VTTIIAILGSGRVATSLAKSGHQIVVGVRDAVDARTWDGLEATFVIEEAIQAADVSPGDTSVER